MTLITINWLLKETPWFFCKCMWQVQETTTNIFLKLDMLKIWRVVWHFNLRKLPSIFLFSPHKNFPPFTTTGEVFIGFIFSLRRHRSFRPYTGVHRTSGLTFKLRAIRCSLEKNTRVAFFNLSCFKLRSHLQFSKYIPELI